MTVGADVFGRLSAFPITPLVAGRLLDAGVSDLVRRAVDGGADSVCVLGSTGSYPYLSREQRRRVAELAVAAAGEVPVLVSIGALATAEVLALADDAQDVGVSGVLLAPMTYQPLTDAEVFGLYEDVTAQLSVPLCVYDNPTTTRVTFTDELLAAVGRLPHVASLKLPGVPADPVVAADRVAAVRALLPPTVTLGVAGDAFAVRGLRAGCDGWYSVLAGVLPRTCRALADGAPAAQDVAGEDLRPVWDLFARFGSLRVITAWCDALGLVPGAEPPRPLRPLPSAAVREVAALARTLAD